MGKGTSSELLSSLQYLLLHTFCCFQLIRAMYSGMATRGLIVPIEMAIRIAVSDAVLCVANPGKPGHEADLHILFVAGNVAGFVKAITTNPFEVLKIQNQLNMKEYRHMSNLDLARKLGLQGKQ